jgi:predicted DNA-binding helix-hairpin-helix protein
VNPKLVNKSVFQILKFHHTTEMNKKWKLQYYSQNYWVFGLFPSSGILETREHEVLETGSVSVLR